MTTTATDYIVTDTMVMDTMTTGSLIPTSTVSSKSPVGHSTTHRTLIIILAILVTITTILLILVAILIAHWYRQKLNKQTIYTLTPHARLKEVPVKTHRSKVFIVTDCNSKTIRKLCHDLCKWKKIDYVYYPFEENYRHDGPGQQGIGVWTEKKFNESDMILFVCNHGFHKVWEGEEISRMDPYFQIISTTKQLFHGHLSVNRSMAKYAVVLLQQSDHQYVPTVLKNIRSFLIDNQGEEALARYILEVPTHVPPCHTE